MDPVEEDSSENIKGKLVPADVAKRNLDAVREALKHLGGKAFGANIVDYLCRNRTDMVRSFGGDKKRLRYCVNGLLSARVNSTYFEKKVYKDNGSTKTEWILAEPYEETEDLTTGGNAPVELSHSEDEDTEKDEMEQDSESDTNTRSPKVRTPKRSTPSSRRRSLRQAQNVVRRPSRYTTSEGGREDTPRTRGARDFGDCFESINAIAEAAFEEHKEKVSNNIDIDDFDSEGDFQTGDTPLTYRGMIKAALESMGSCGTFESISKFIGVHFKDQLTNKAETWKHSIAGCLSVYFARKEEKDNSGKVIWTLEDPPKPKRRIRKRDRDDIMSTNAERETTTRIISAKRRKDDMILISIEQLEALEEENECLKLLNVKKREEKTEASFNMGDGKASCSCCLERKELCMKLTPCGHIFCGSIFCEASTSKTCQICKADVVQRLPYHQNGNVKILRGIFDTLANVVTSSSPEFDLVNKSAITV